MIDDDPVMVHLVTFLLRRQGYSVEARLDAAEGIDHAEQSPPDVVLLDILMPGLGGIEACRRLRSSARLGRVPVMFFSAGAKEEFIERGFQAGAQDYLEKPFSEAELLARVASLTRLARYEQSLRNVAEELRTRNELLSLELEAASRVQAALLPVSLAPHPALRCDRLYEPMVGVGGDLYDVTAGPDGTVRVLVADISGHGVFAALLASFFKMGYQVYSDRESSPARVFSSLNRELCRSLDSGHYVTAFTGWLDPRTGRLRYASAGHVSGLLRRRGELEIIRLQPTGPMVGILDDARFEESALSLEPGDVLLLLTDGVLEAPDAGGETYGLARLERLLLRHPRSQPNEILQDLRIDLDQFQGSVLPDDDMTALALQWVP